MDGDLTELADALPGQRVLIVGDYMLDEYLFGPTERISPEAPVPVLRAQRRESRLGGAGSVAAMVRALAGQADCVGLVGSDANGQTLREMLASTGAATAGLIVSPQRPTTHKLRIVGLAQLRHPQQMVRVDTEDASPVAPDIEAAIVAAAESALANCSIVCLQDYAKGVLTPRVCQAIIAAARHARRRVLVDPARLNDYTKYAGASCLTPNRTEAMLATGLPNMDGPNADKAARQLAKVTAAEAMTITLDRDGAYLLDRAVPVEGQTQGAPSYGSRTDTDNWRGRLVPTRPRVVYDNAGAGDMVLATMALSLAAGASWEQSVRLANIGGGLEVERYGVQPIALADLRAALTGGLGRGPAKIVSQAALLTALGGRRAVGERVVFTNGVFDLLHPGHVEYLQAARQLGDVLVVALNSDESARALAKGPERPVYGIAQRAAMVAALEAVDYVAVFDSPTPAELIAAVRPDVLVKGEDYRDKPVVGREVVERGGGRVVLLPLKAGYSTTALVARLRS